MVTEGGRFGENIGNLLTGTTTVNRKVTTAGGTIELLKNLQLIYTS